MVNNSMVGKLQRKIDALEKKIDRMQEVQDRLEKSEGKYRILADNVTDIIVVLDPDFIFKYVSPSIQRILGYTPEETIGRNLDELIKPESMKYVLEVMHDEQENVEPYRFRILNFESYRKDGSKVWIEGTMSYRRDKENKPIEIICVARDVTKRKQTEEKIERLNKVKEDLLGPGRLEEKLYKITESVVEIFDAELARIWITKPGDLCESGCIHGYIKDDLLTCTDRDYCLHLRASSGSLTHIDGDYQRIPFGCYEIGRFALGNDQKYVNNSFATDNIEYEPNWIEKTGIVSFALYSLLAESGTSIGLLALFCNHHISSNNDILLENLASTAAQVIKTSMTEDELKKHRDHLEELVNERTHNLKEANIALRVLVKNREKDKIKLEEKMMFNVKNLINPYIEMMHNCQLDRNQQMYLNILESNLNDIISPFSYSLTSKILNLTPSEIRVVNLLRQNKTTKEIAEILDLCTSTIDSHRKNIRKKVGITNKKTNLITHLLSFLE